MHNARGHNNLFEPCQLSHSGLSIEQHFHASQCQHVPMPPDESQKLLLPGNPACHAELPADLAGPFEQRHRMTPLGRNQRGGKSGRACAHDRDRHRLDRRTIDQFGFVGHLRIDDTCRDLHLKDETKACLIARNAGRDLGRPSVARLSHEVRICKKGPGHRDQVRGTFRLGLLDHRWRVDPDRRNHRDPDQPRELLGDPSKCTAAHARSNRRDPGFMPPDS